MNSSQFLGKHVMGEEGWRIGEVKDLVVDTTDWQVKALDVQLFPNVADEFGMKKLLRTTHIPIDIEHVKAVGDAVILKISKAHLKSMINATEPVAKMVAVPATVPAA